MGVRDTTRIPLIVRSSDTAIVIGAVTHVDSNPLEFQVILAGAAVVDLEGSLDGVNWVDLTYDNAAGAYTITALSNVGAGYYKVHERPKYVRMITEIDAGGPRDFYAVLIVKDQS